MGSQMRAAPSISSITILVLRGLSSEYGFSSVIHPGSTQFIRIPSTRKSGADVLVIMLMPALAIFVWGCRQSFSGSLKLPSIADTLTIKETGWLVDFFITFFN